MLSVFPRERSDSVRTQELLFIEHSVENPAKLLLIQDCKQPAIPITRNIGRGDVDRKIRVPRDKFTGLLQGLGNRLMVLSSNTVVAHNGSSPTIDRILSLCPRPLGKRKTS